MSKEVLNEKRKPSGYIDKKYASYFKNARIASELSEDEAAERIGISTRTLRRLEAGWDISLKITSILKMSKLYNISFGSDEMEEDADSFESYSDKRLKIISAISTLDANQLMILYYASRMITSPTTDKDTDDTGELDKMKLQMVQDIPVLSKEKIDFLLDLVEKIQKPKK